MRNILRVALLFIFCALPAAAQPDPNPIPVLESAESVFQTALQAYQDREYDVAARLFGVAANTYEFHRKTTAASVMRAKALYHRGDYAQAVADLEAFLARFPRSRYAIEATNTLTLAQQGIDQTANRRQILRLGIALPLNDEAAPLTQEMFNGIRLAVDNYNADAMVLTDGVARPLVQMVFRDTRNDPAQARAAVATLVNEDRVSAIVGPLFSNEAEAAARAAEELQVVLVAPLATAETVARGRSYVFQANPTFSMRGRLMGRFAVNGLRLNTVGMIVDGQSTEDRLLASHFADEVLDLGAELAYETYLPDSRSWFRLGETMSRDSLQAAEAVFFPITGSNASTLISAAFSSLDRMGATIRVLGSESWHNLPMRTQAGRYNVTYMNSYHVDEADTSVQAFLAQYRDLAGAAPERLAFTGYDVSRFLLDRFEQSTFDARPLVDLLRAAGLHHGLGTRLDFTQGNVNQAMYYHRYMDGAPVLLR